jgi:glycosyltransferase involved in cell wall biosynthesis
LGDEPHHEGGTCRTGNAASAGRRQSARQPEPQARLSMYKDRKVVVVLPAYNAERTLEKTYAEIPLDVVDEVILVDDHSDDATVAIASRLGIKHITIHEKNSGYGANQKTCYNQALALNADIVVMLHPDYQYTPHLVPAMVTIIGNEIYPVVFGSRILGKGALSGGMPAYKYIANRFLTLFQNLLMNQKLSEYHTGFRAYARQVLEKIPFERNSDDFVFDNEVVAQIFYNGFDIAEVTCPTKYFKEASSINFVRSVRYGFGVLRVSVLYFLTRAGLYKWRLLSK